MNAFGFFLVILGIGFLMCAVPSMVVALGYRECHACAKPISAWAKKCPHCHTLQGHIAHS